MLRLALECISLKLWVVVCVCLLGVACASQDPGNTGQTTSSSDTGDVEISDVGSDVDSVEDSAVAEDSGTVAQDVGGDLFIADPFACIPEEEVCDGLDNDCNGQVDDSACPCSDETVCYGGPVQTRGVGECRDGGRTCSEGGEFFGECTQWQGPEEELCEDGLDNNCNGVLDEAPCVEICEEGDARPCWPGAPSQDGVGACSRGTERCNAATGRWGSCEDAQLPVDETCEDEADNDCDGFVNEVCCLDEEFCGDGEDTDCDGELDEGCPEAIEEQFTVGELSEARAVDLVLAVDNSNSMTDTVAEVEGNLASLSARMVEEGIDYRVTMISERGADPEGPDVCIPGPLAGMECGNGDRFLHLDHRVGSHSAFEDILACEQGCEEGSFRPFLRDNGLLQVIVVSDDESDLRWSMFRDQMAARGLGGLVLHAVVGLRLGGCSQNVGDRYVDGALETGGALLHVCDNDWGEVIDVIFDATLMRLQGSFALSRDPIVASIQVLAGAAGEEPQEQIGNWVYVSDGNSVDFLPGQTPPLNHRVVVRYQSAAE